MIREDDPQPTTWIGTVFFLVAVAGCSVFADAAAPRGCDPSICPGDCVADVCYARAAAFGAPHRSPDAGASETP